MDLTGFLFGNVNEEGELEDESLLDRVYPFKAHHIQQYYTYSAIMHCNERPSVVESYKHLANFFLYRIQWLSWPSLVWGVC